MLITTLIVAFSLTGIAGQAELVPAGDEALTIDLELDGYANGNMDRDRLMSLGSCTLERDAAYTYALMMEAAARSDVYLGPIDCYRSYRQQDNAYNRRCPVKTVPIFDTDPITGEIFETGSRSGRVCTGPPIAKAGASNHGWGRAVDFSDGRGVLNCRDRAFLWLQANAYQFGWVLPPWAECGRRTAEPWHWEYAGLAEASLLPLLDLNNELMAVVE